VDVDLFKWQDDKIRHNGMEKNGQVFIPRKKTSQYRIVLNNFSIWHNMCRKSTANSKGTRMKNTVIVLIAICSILLPIVTFAEIYTWVDMSGIPHFSDSPPLSGEVAYETIGEAFPAPRKEKAPEHAQMHHSQSDSTLYSGKPLYFWRDQFEMLTAKIAMKQGDIRLLKSAIDKTDMYHPEKKSGMIIYPCELRVDGRHLNTRDQFIEEWTRQTQRLKELEQELQRLRNKAQMAGVPLWVWENYHLPPGS
jgi:hypothetical protein